MNRRDFLKTTAALAALGAKILIKDISIIFSNEHLIFLLA